MNITPLQQFDSQLVEICRPMVNEAYYQCNMHILGGASAPVYFTSFFLLAMILALALSRFFFPNTWNGDAVKHVLYFAAILGSILLSIISYMYFFRA